MWSATILSGCEAVKLSLLDGIVKRAIEFHDWKITQWITLLNRYIFYLFMYTTVPNQSKCSLHDGDFIKKELESVLVAFVKLGNCAF